MKKTIPYWLFLFGLFALFCLGKENLAIGCLFSGIMLIIDRIWPCVKEE